MSWTDDECKVQEPVIRLSWMDELTESALKTAKCGASDMYANMSFHMKQGKCPVCGKTFECTAQNIFHPYCGYTCKRVIERPIEEKMRQKAQQAEARERERHERELAARQANYLKKAAAQREQKLKDRLEEANRKWLEATLQASQAPKGSRLRQRAGVKARGWYKKIIEIQQMIRALEDGK